ncbi:MAG: hypothetical protein NC347_01910 [Clostridium sp.]|nr:hypothetical protein [Clostridium sp.]
MADLLEVLNAITEFLYQEKKNDAYGLLARCLPILSSFLEEMTDIGLQTEIKDALQEAMEAMEADDVTLLADILQYEVIERLATLEEE